jgi:hypothetical protein
VAGEDQVVTGDDTGMPPGRSGDRHGARAGRDYVGCPLGPAAFRGSPALVAAAVGHRPAAPASCSPPALAVGHAKAAPGAFPAAPVAAAESAAPGEPAWPVCPCPGGDPVVADARTGRTTTARPRSTSPAAPDTKPNAKSAAASNATQPAASTASWRQPPGPDNP